jgi:hypothetical protein
MASPQEVNRQVALALGRVIIPLDKADCHTHAEGVKYLYGERDAEGRLRLFRTVRLSTDGNSCIATDEFNPAENPGDALACLEEWREKHKGFQSACMLLDPDGAWSVEIFMVNSSNAFVATMPTAQEAICQAILNAEAGK